MLVFRLDGFWIFLKLILIRFELSVNPILLDMNKRKETTPSLDN